MNLQENIQRIRVLIEQTTPETKKIFVDMGGVLFPSGSNDEVQKGTTEKPQDIKGFQSWVINTKQDNQILGNYGADGKWGRNTSNAWVKYGEEYKKSFPDSVSQQTSGQTNFIGSSLWNNIKQHQPTILSSVGSTNTQQKIQNKTKQVTDILQLPAQNAIFVNSGKDKARYAKGNILIDDSPENIAAWESAGGIGILHKNNDETLKQLSQHVS
jgi:hypothetical protein